MVPDVTERIESLEEYRAEHEASIRAWWDQQWRTNADHEARLRLLEKFSYRIIGATVMAAFLGAGLGGMLLTQLFGGGS